MKNLNLVISKCAAAVFTALIATSFVAVASGNHTGGHHESPIGNPGVVAKVNRTIEVDMNDTMRYTPSDITVKKGETIRFTVKNSGKVAHEMSLGTEKELLAHLEEMKKFPGMEHDEPNKLTLAPGKAGEIIWQFSKAGTVNFACLMPGHYEAGMKGKVQVTADSMGMAPTPSLTDGVVKKIDKALGKITIQHGEIKHLDMPGMTMVFLAKDKALLDKVQPGEKVRFMVAYENGKMTVTDIQAAN